MRHSLAIAVLALTASVAHAGRYDVRDPQTGRFMKLSATHAAESHGGKLVAPTASLISTHTAAKGTVFGWVKSNFTVSATSDHLVAVSALRKEGRVGEAVHALEHAPAPRGFLERVLIGRATNKVRNASMITVKQAARSGDAHAALDAAHALSNLRGSMGWFARFRADRAINAGQKLALQKARADGQSGNLDAAAHDLNLAAHLGADGRRLDRGASRFERAAMKQAARAAKQGDLEATGAALEHAAGVPGSRLTDEQASAIMTKSATNAMKTLVKTAKAAYRSGDKHQAARAMLQLKNVHELSGAELSGGARRDMVRMNAVLGPHMSELAAADDSEHGDRQADIALNDN